MNLKSKYKESHLISISNLVSLALAGTLTFTMFYDTIKESKPQKSMSDLKKEKASIKKTEKKRFTSHELIAFQEALATMQGVNENTEKDLITTITVRIEAWSKTESNEEVMNALEWIRTGFKVRQQQYDNLLLIANKRSAPKEIIDEIHHLKSLTNQSDEKVKLFKEMLQAYAEAKLLFDEIVALNLIVLDDYWTPSFETENNILLLSSKEISALSFDKIEELEEKVNISIDSSLKKSKYYLEVSFV